LSGLQERLEEIWNKIIESAAKSGNNPKDITLVVVTKSVGVNTIKELIDLGVKNIGENRVQDFTKKYEGVSSNVAWHFIGHLQSNKAKYLTGKVQLIHSLDRISLALELERLGQMNNQAFNCLVQVNVSGEKSKHGLNPKEVENFLVDVSKMNYVKVKGLMTMAPLEALPEDTRHVFRSLRKLKNALQKIDIPEVDLKYLSMGMSNDYHIAIEEGSNMVRIGSAILHGK